MLSKISKLTKNTWQMVSKKYEPLNLVWIKGRSISDRLMCVRESINCEHFKRLILPNSSVVSRRYRQMTYFYSLGVATSPFYGFR